MEGRSVDRATYRRGLQSDEAGFCGPFITLAYCIVVDGCSYLEYDTKRKIYLKEEVEILLYVGTCFIVLLQI